MNYYHVIDSPLGPLLLTSDGDRLTGTFMGADATLERVSASDKWQRTPAVFTTAEAQLRAYFARELKVFDLPLHPLGTTFQQQVWNYLSSIPYGSTVSYKTVAAALGSPKSMRAVGMANGRNPISIIIPCHRVIGANGTLTGYRGGLWRKQWLMNFECGLPLPELTESDLNESAESLFTAPA